MLNYLRGGLLFFFLVWTLALEAGAQVELNRISTAERQDGQGYVVRLHLSESLNTFQLRQTNFNNVRLQLDDAVPYPDSIKIEEVTYPFQDVSLDSTSEGSVLISIDLASTIQLKAEVYQDRFSNDLLVGLSYPKHDLKYGVSDSLVKQMFNLIPVSSWVSDPEFSSLEQVQNLFEQEFQKTNIYELNRDRIEAQIKNEKDNLGLSVGTSYRENFGQGFAIGAGISYQRRVQLGVQWNLLNGGLLDSRSEVEQLNDELQSVHLEEDKSVKEDLYNQRYNAFIKLFNERKIEVLQKGRTVLEKQAEQARHFYHAKSISWEQVLNVISNLEQTKSQLESYKDYNTFTPVSFDSARPTVDLPMFNLDIENLLNSIGQTALQQKLYQLQSKKISREHAVWRDVNLDLSLDYTYYNSVGSSFFSVSGTQGDRGYFSAGVQLSLPLPLGASSSNELIEAKKDHLKYQNRREQLTKREQVLNHYHEYQFTVKQYLNFASKLRDLEEKIRRDRARWKVHDPNFSITTLWSHLNSIYQTKLELIDIKQKAYLKLLKIDTYVDNVPITELVEPINEDMLYEKYGFGRSIYVWSETFDKHRNSFLTEYFINNRIDQILLSASERAFRSGKVGNFIKEMHKQGTEVHLLAGVNTLIEADRTDKLNTYAARIDSLDFDGLHLDVEPHTFEDWEQEKDYYQQSYIEMLQQADSLLSDRHKNLGVSVPVMYTKNFLEQIQKYSDHLYVMAYGTGSAEQINERTKEERGLAGVEAIVALRTGDFEDRVIFESFMRQLSTELNLSRIAIQDLGGLINLDDEVIDYQN